MTAVVHFEHRGLPCAIPAAQAKSVDVRVPDEALTALWEGAESARHPRALEVRVKERALWVGCGEPRLHDLPKSDAIGLSPLLRRILASLPHVVGMATIDGRHTWLVDVERLGSVAQRTEALR